MAALYSCCSVYIAQKLILMHLLVFPLLNQVVLFWMHAAFVKHISNCSVTDMGQTFFVMYRSHSVYRL